MKNRSLFVFALAIGLTQAVEASPIQFAGNGHWYDLVGGFIDWETAKVAAESQSYQGLQGHLATITSSEENAFISDNIANGDYLILGATDKVSEGIWQWVTGEAFSYSNWSGGEPTNSSGNENYLVLWPGGVWNDVRNDDPYSYGYIVEYEPNPVPVPSALFLFVSGMFSVFGVKHIKKKLV